MSRKVWTAFAVAPMLHAAPLRRVNERSAAIAFVVEQAAPADAQVRALWQQMNHNRLVGVRWAVRTLLAKPGMDHLASEKLEPVFLVAFDWGTFCVLTDVLGLTADEYEAWIVRCYRRMLLEHGGAVV
jgi:hypothetical protein